MIYVTARSGTIAGPVLPYDSGSIKDAYDPRRHIRNPMTQPQSCTTHLPIHSNKNSGKQHVSSSGVEQHQQYSRQHQHHHHHHHHHSKIQPDIAIDMSSSTYYNMARTSRPDFTDTTNMLQQANPPFVGVVVAATAGSHMNGSTMSSMY